MSTEPQKKIETRFSEAEDAMVCDMFKGRDDLLQITRNLLLGHQMTDDEKDTIRSVFKTESSRKVMRKYFIPELEKTDPVTNYMTGSQDLYMTVNLKDKSWIEYPSLVKVSEEVVKMLEVALKLLENPDAKPVDLSAWKQLSESEFRTEMFVARNNFIVHINQQIFNLKVKSSIENETVDEVKKRLLADSSK